MNRIIQFCVVLLATTSLAQAQIVIEMHTLGSDKPQLLGTITASNTIYGLLLTPQLHDLAPGVHGLHMHEHPTCTNGGLGAGRHFDPQGSNKHFGPYSPDGHLGDLPALTISNDGAATLPILAPRLKEHDLRGHSIIIHVGGDNYADIPKNLGGGGARLACGIIAEIEMIAKPVTPEQQK